MFSVAHCVDFFTLSRALASARHTRPLHVPVLVHAAPLKSREVPPLTVLDKKSEHLPGIFLPRKYGRPVRTDIRSPDTLVRTGPDTVRTLCPDTLRFSTW